MTISSTRILHLVVLPAVAGEPRLASEGPYGCDYAWNADFTAYRCMPHRWNPFSEQSYIDHMLDGRDFGGEYEDPEDIEMRQREAAEDKMWASLDAKPSEPQVDDGIPF